MALASKPTPVHLPDPVIVLTRPFPAAYRTARALRAFNVTCPILYSPIVTISPIDTGALPEGTLVFTSENGVRCAGNLHGRTVVTVGRRTAEATRAAGASAEALGNDVNALKRAIIARGGGPYTHLRGLETTGDLVDSLRIAGIDASERVVYRQVTRPMTEAAHTALLSDRATCLPLFSVRSAERVAAAIKVPPRATTVVAISHNVAESWPWSPVALVADKTDLAAMCDAIGTAIESQPTGGKTT